MENSTPRRTPSASRWLITAGALSLFFLLVNTAWTAPRNRSTTALPNATGVVVHTKFGGQILGYDVDQSGTQGLLSEFVAQFGGGSSVVATETFDQATGKILKVVAKKTNTQDDYVTYGIAGNHVGLVLYQHVLSLFHVQNHFRTMDPFTGNKFTGVWTPTIPKGYSLGPITHNQGTANVATYVTSMNTGIPLVFSSNVATNTFGRKISLKSISNNGEFQSPSIAYDGKTNQAVLSASFGCRTCTPSIATVDLATGKIDEFTGLGFGSTNGLAVDPATGTACTTTEIDFSVEFYDLKKHTGTIVTLPGASGQIQSGGDVEFDPIHHLFLVHQYTSTGNINDPQPHIYVYDVKGNLKNTVTGLQRTSLLPYVALNPAKRTGLVDIVGGAEFTVTSLQAFSY
jgi:hypothetical protein